MSLHTLLPFIVVDECGANDICVKDGKVQAKTVDTEGLVQVGPWEFITNTIQTYVFFSFNSLLHPPCVRDQSIHVSAQFCHFQKGGIIDINLLFLYFF